MHITKDTKDTRAENQPSNPN